MSAASATAPAPDAALARARTRVAPARALARQAVRNGRTSTAAFGALFAVFAYTQPTGYRAIYPTLADRLGVARTFGDNAAMRLFYGAPRDLVTLGGYSAWRVGGILAVGAAVYGLLAAVRALRTEEDTGRAELVLAGGLGRRTMYLSAMLALTVGTFVLGLAEFAGSVAAGLPAGGSAFLALATVSIVPVCAGVGALASQLAPTRRLALALGGAMVGLLFLLRVVADTSGGLVWLRWVTPLGWAEEMDPFTGAQPVVLLLPLAASVLMLTAAARIAFRRDVGSGVLAAHDRAAPRLGLLSSTSAQAFRDERGGLLVWTVGVGVYALIIGAVSKSISSDGIGKGVQRATARLDAGSIVTPAGYLSLVFVFFILAVSLFACSQVGAARHAEGDQQLETLFALPLSRRRWLGGRLLLATGGAVTIALVAGLMTWAGAASQGVSISLPRMLEAGANCLPVALLFLGLAVLAFALVPRASAAVAYSLVAVAFLWDLSASLLDAPKWLLDLTPFAHVGLVPAQPLRVGAALAMLAIGALSALVALAAFGRRDLAGT